MRLIDADALKEAMNYNGGCGICFRYIDDADTIPAIPVEWLMDLANRGDFVYGAVARWKQEQEAQDE